MSRASYPQTVRVYCTYQEPDYESPWQTRPPRSSTSSGVVIASGRILTGAHCVAHATFLQVQKGSSPAKVVATVLSVCHDSDLAVLAVEKSFTRGIKSAEIGDLSRLGDEVSVVGYPVGGDELSITEGIVSRIEVQSYEHSDRSLLAVTVDAAINSGNSGGPVFHRGKVVGIAFQSLEDAENIGEMVPAPIIKTFLEGVRRKKPPLVPGLGVVTQHLENPALRKSLGLRKEEGGILIKSVEFGTSAWGKLRPGDVLLEIDGMKIAANGTVRYLGRFRCQFDVVFGERFVGDKVEGLILREGRRRAIQLTLGPMAWLVPRACHDTRPDWFTFAGLVLTPLSVEFLRVWGDEWWKRAPTRLVHAYYHGDRTEECQELLVIAQVLADEVNVGYESFEYEVIASVNGRRPKDLRDAVSALDAAAESVTLTTESGSVLHFELADVAEANLRIEERYRMPGDRSDALRS